MVRGREGEDLGRREEIRSKISWPKKTNRSGGGLRAFWGWFGIEQIATLSLSQDYQFTRCLSEWDGSKTRCFSRVVGWLGCPTSAKTTVFALFLKLQIRLSSAIFKLPTLQRF